MHGHVFTTCQHLPASYSLDNSLLPRGGRAVSRHVAGLATLEAHTHIGRCRAIARKVASLAAMVTLIGHQLVGAVTRHMPVLTAVEAADWAIDSRGCALPPALGPCTAAAAAARTPRRTLHVPRFLQVMDLNAPRAQLFSYRISCRKIMGFFRAVPLAQLSLHPCHVNRLRSVIVTRIPVTTAGAAAGAVPLAVSLLLCPGAVRAASTHANVKALLLEPALLLAIRKRSRDSAREGVMVAAVPRLPGSTPSDPPAR